MPRQLGVGVKFAAELLVMGLRMTLHTRPDFIIVGVDIWNAYCELMRAIVIERHLQHDKLSGMVPYRRAKLGPVAKTVGGEGHDGIWRRTTTRIPDVIVGFLVHNSREGQA